MGQSCCRQDAIKLIDPIVPTTQDSLPEPIIIEKAKIIKKKSEISLKQQIEVESTDSDIITEPMKPKPPLKPSTVSVFDDEIEEILNKEFIKIMSEFVDKIKIDKMNIKAMMSDQDNDGKQMAEEFLCIFCNKFVIPHFILGKDGIKKESVKIPECQNCHHFSCYQCFKKQLYQENSHCTRCYLQIQSPYPKYNPPKQTDFSNKSFNGEKKINHEISSAQKNQIQKDLEKQQLEQYNKKYQQQIDEINKNIDNYMTFCSNKKLLNIIFNQKIVHKCQIREDEATLKAKVTWENVYKHFEEQMKRTGETPFQVLTQIEQQLQFQMKNVKNRYKSEIQQFNSNIFERSETIFEGGQDDEVQIDEQNQENNNAENANEQENQDQQQEEGGGDGDQQEQDQQNEENGDANQQEEENLGEENYNSEQKEAEDDKQEDENNEEENQEEQQEENNDQENQEDEEKQEEENEIEQNVDGEDEGEEKADDQGVEEEEKANDQNEDEGEEKVNSQGEDEVEENIDDGELQNEEIENNDDEQNNDLEGKADSQFHEEEAANNEDDVQEEEQEKIDQEASEKGLDKDDNQIQEEENDEDQEKDDQSQDENEEQKDNNEQENGEEQEDNKDEENNDKSLEVQYDDKDEDKEISQKKNSEIVSNQNEYNQSIQDKSNIGDFNEIEDKSEHKIFSIQNEEEEVEQFDETDKIEENQDEDIPDTPQKSESQKSKQSKIQILSNNVSMVKQETENNQEAIYEIFNEDLNEENDDQSQQSKVESQMSSVKQSHQRNVKSQMTSVKESELRNVKSQMTSVKESDKNNFKIQQSSAKDSQQSNLKIQLPTVKETQQKIKSKIVPQISNQSNVVVQEIKITTQKLQVSNSKKDIQKVNKIQGMYQFIQFDNIQEINKKINNIVDDKSEEYMQHTTAFETVNSKTRKDTQFKNYNYDVNQLDEVNESIESFKNSQNSKQKVAQNKNQQNSIKSKLNNVELLKQLKNQNKQNKNSEKSQINEAEYKEMLLKQIQDEFQKTINQKKIQQEEEQIIFNQKKQQLIEKLTESFLDNEFKFLYYLNHIVSECPLSDIPESFCPFRKCKKNKIPMKLNSLRKHFVNQCTKIKMQCFHCEDKFRRPWIPYHDCRRVYIQRIQNLSNQLNESLNFQHHQSDIIKEKDEIIQVFFEERAKFEQQQRIKETIRDKMVQSNYLEKINNETQKDFKKDMKQSDLIPEQNRSISAALHSKQYFKQKRNDENLSKLEKFRKMELASQDSYYGLNKPTMQSVGVGQTQVSQYSKGIGQSDLQFKANKVVNKIREQSAQRRLEPIQNQDTKKTPSIHILNDQNISIKERGSQSVIHKKNSRMTIDCDNTQEYKKMSTIVSNQSQMQQNQYKNNYVETQISNNTVQVNKIEYTENYQEKRFRRDSRNSKIRIYKKQFNTQEGSEYQHQQDQIMNLQKQQILTEVGKNPSNKKNKDQIIVVDDSLELEKDDQSNFKQKKLTDCVQKLKIVEQELSQLDKYIESCINKYKQFTFNILLLLDQEKIELSNFVKNYEVKQGQFKGSLFWGLILPQVKGSFQPHGFGIFYNKTNKMMQLGTFKNGLEHGQQRVIQSLPSSKRYFTQFTAINGKLNGPAMIDRSDQRIEIGNYKADKQDGTWRYRFNDGRIEQVHFSMGVLQ